MSQTDTNTVVSIEAPVLIILVLLFNVGSKVAANGADTDTWA